MTALPTYCRNRLNPRVYTPDSDNESWLRVGGKPHSKGEEVQLPSHCRAAMLCLLFTRGSQREPRCPPPSALPGASPKPFPTPNRVVWGLLPSLESPAPYVVGG